MLFRILRGTGIAGLAGIPYRRGPFVRPLLDVRRAQILAYLAKRKIEYFTDPSNVNRRYARSRIRHDVLPALARENPRVVEALLALAREAQDKGVATWRKDLPAELYLPRRAVDAVDGLMRKGGGTRMVSVRKGELTVRDGKVSWLPRKPGDVAQATLTWKPWAGFQALRPSPPSTTPLASLGLARSGSAGQSPATPTQLAGEVQRVSGPGEYRIFDPPAPGLDIAPACSGAWPGGNSACFDTAKLEWPLCVRALRPGDRMAPRGGRGTRKLSDLLIDAKIPRQERASLPVLCDASGAILCVPGLRPSEIGRPSGETLEWIEVHVLR